MTPTEVRTQSDIRDLPLRRYEDRNGLAQPSRLISWGAVFAGAAVGLVLQMWLTMLGVAIGASTIDPLREADPMEGLGVGSAVWLALSLIISSYVGGWVTGRLAGMADRVEAGLHGAASWAVVNLAAFLLVGTVLGGTMSGLTRITGQASNIVGSAVTGRGDDLRAQAGDLLRDAQNQTASAANARQAGDRAAKAVSGTGWGVVILMFLGLCAGVAGAATTAPNFAYLDRRPAV
jgi:hypothetical protein